MGLSRVTPRVLKKCERAKRTQADALLIDSQAKRRLADEYDAAQGRGEVSVRGQHGDHVPDENMRATVADLSLTRKQVHEAAMGRSCIDPWMAQWCRRTARGLVRCLVPRPFRTSHFGPWLCRLSLPLCCQPWGHP